MSEKELLSNAFERHIVVKDENTKSGYRILSDNPHLWNGKEHYGIKHQYILVPTPDYEFGFIVMGLEYGQIKVYHEVVKIFSTMKEASDWVFNHNKNMRPNKSLTKEEYELLKEVLLWD